MAAEPVPSIHYQRRWYYVLWVALLALAGAAWVLWERPAAAFQATLLVQVRLRYAPPGVQAAAWCGPEAAWPGSRGSGQDSPETALRPDRLVSLPALRLPVARRRWVRDYIPWRTWSLVVLRFTAPGTRPRYLALPCDRDLRSALPRGRCKLFVSINFSWNDLGTDASAPVRIP